MMNLVRPLALVGLGLLSIAGLSGCATSGGSSASLGSVDAGAAARARPYLEGYQSLDPRLEPSGVACAEPRATGEWKMWVAAGSACAQKDDLAMLEKVGQELADRFVDAPWGAYYLGLSAARRGESLRAHWMFELAEKKAGGRLAIVRYETARLLEQDGESLAAAKEMKEAVRLEPQLLAAQLWLAQVHHRDRLLREARSYYQKVLELKADHYASIVGLADVEAELKNGREAADLLLRAVSMKPEAADNRWRLAFVFENLTREPEKALETLKDLKSSLDRGRARGAVMSSDLTSKIKNLEAQLKPVQAREPAQKKGG